MATLLDVSLHLKLHMAHPGRPRNCDPRVKSLWSEIEYKQNDKVITTLKEVGVDCPDGEARTALLNACLYQNFDIVNWTLNNGADINYQDRIGYTALHFAAEKNSDELTRYLLDKGANPNLQDMHGNIPLWTAMFSSKLVVSDTIKLLLKHKSDYNLTNNYGRTPKLMFETFYGGDISNINSDNV